MMNRYLYSIIILALIIGIVKSVTADMSSGVKKYVSFISGLIMVTIILVPFKNITENIINIKDSISNITDSIYSNEHINNSNSIIINTGKEKISQGIKDALITKFGFDEKDIYVNVNTDETNINAIKILSVDIILTNKASWSNVKTVEEYTENLIGVNANVTRK